MKNDMMVSINCITYNHEDFIADAIESFLAQKTTFRYEILIHDDASTDRTSEIIREYQQKYPEIIKPIIQEKNQYSTGNIKISYEYNHKRAKGKYIAFCEGDDYWTDPLKLQKQVNFMEKNPQYTLCAHATKMMQGASDVVMRLIRPFPEDREVAFEDVLLGGGGFFATSSLLYVKSALDNPPRFFFDSPVGDYPTQILLALHGKVFYMDETMSAYRYEIKGSWSQKTNSSDEKRIRVIKQFLRLLDEVDAYTGKRYAETIAGLKQRLSFSIHVIEGDFKAIRLPVYRDLYKKLSAKEKLTTLLKCYVPHFRKWMNHYKLSRIQQ